MQHHDPTVADGGAFSLCTGTEYATVAVVWTDQLLVGSEGAAGAGVSTIAAGAFCR